MGPQTLLLSAMYALVVAAAFAFVGRRVRERAVVPDASLAQEAFAVWWFALAASSASSAVVDLLGYAGVAQVALVSTGLQINILALATGLGALLYYIIYLVTGRRQLLGPIVGFAIVYYVLGLTFITQAEPIGVAVTAWGVSPIFPEPVPGFVDVTLVMLTVLPRVLGVFALFTVFFALERSDQRLRMATMCWGVLVWTQGALLSGAPGMLEADWLQVASHSTGMAGSVFVALAYAPGGPDEPPS